MFKNLLLHFIRKKYIHIGDISYTDIEYVAQKALISYIRGFLWSIMHFRWPLNFFLGPYTRILGGRLIALEQGVSIGGYSYVEAFSVQGVYISRNVTIREHAWIQCRSGLNEPAEKLMIGANTYIGPYSVIGVGGSVVIGENCQIGARLTISAESHKLGVNGTYVSGAIERKGVLIGNNCWFGNNVTVLDGVKVGNNCVIGAGSIVTKSISSNNVAYGNPAKVRRCLVESGN